MPSNLGFEALEITRSIYHNTPPPKIPIENVKALSDILAKNRIHVAAHKYLSSMKGEMRNQGLLNELGPMVEKDKILARYRDKMVERAVSVLDGHNISYAIFKTYCPSGYVGVDSDFIVPLEDLPKTITFLLNSGFYLIDDTRKKYATGLIIKGNPIILDLHTDLTVAGVSYLKPELIFKYTVEKSINLGDRKLTIHTPDDMLEAIIRVLHSLVKEAELKLSDIYDSLMLFQKYSLTDTRAVFSEIGLSRELVSVGLKIDALALDDSHVLEKMGKTNTSRWALIERKASEKMLEGDFPIKLGTNTHLQILANLARSSQDSRKYLLLIGNILSRKSTLKYSVKKVLGGI
ncbi:MAG: hypothetical protein ABSB40_02145 [Nitrososphaeria archaeon]|jgi:hypothetical protein